MSIIETIPEAEATGAVREIYDAEIRQLGYVPSHTKAMALNPDALHAFENLTRAAAAGLGLRRYELITLAAATTLRSESCRIAHARRTVRAEAADEATVIAALGDFTDAPGLSEAEVEMMRFAQKLSQDSSAMTDADTARLREVGFTDREIVDITLAAAVRNFYSRALHALAVDVDVPPDLSPGLRAALGV